MKTCLQNNYEYQLYLKKLKKVQLVCVYVINKQIQIKVHLYIGNPRKLERTNIDEHKP